MTSYNASQIPLITLLFRDDNPALHEFNHTLSSIDQYYDRLPAALRDESLRDLFVLHPDRTFARLEKAFGILKSNHLSAPIAEQIFKSIVLPLVNVEETTLSLVQSVKLVGAALPLVIESPTSYLKQVAMMLLSYERLLLHLLADGKYCLVLKKWLSSKRTYLDDIRYMAMTETLISMCDACIADHDINQAHERWDQVKQLIQHLQQEIQAAEEKSKVTQSKENLPPVGSMKLLNVDDKKTNATRRESSTPFIVPESIQKALEKLSIPKVCSLSAMSQALVRIQTEVVPQLMRDVLETLPCRLCQERLTGADLTFSDKTCQHFYEDIDLNTPIDIEIFGKRIGPWKVVLSESAMNNAKKISRAGGFVQVDTKLRRLATGKWTKLSQVVGTAKQQQQMRVPIVRAHVNDSVSIIWQVDVGYYEELPFVQQQIVKVWRIATSSEEINNAIEHIIEVQDGYCDDIVMICKDAPTRQPDGIRLPKRYESVARGVSHTKRVLNSMAGQAVIETSNRFYNVTESFLRSIQETTGQEEFPFDLSPEEWEIISHFNSASLILGRSGTGKTTCLLFKILAKYQTARKIPGSKYPRQLLLTRSPFLAAKLQAYARSLIATQCASTMDVDSTDTEKPVSFFAIKDEDFPFVCSYDEFLDLLDSTFRRADRQDFLEDTDSTRKKLILSNKRAPEIQSLDGTKIVDFHVFKTEYWSSLAGLTPAACSPELLFAEIMGVIKGSITAAKSLESLTRVQYLTKSTKISPAFSSEGDRQKIFDAFDRYERVKKGRSQIDELDRVNLILKNLKSTPDLANLIRRCFDEIYVDEIQDLRCPDVLLLLSCLRDARGIHLAGDTAQCISKDSAFRFPEIKALFYEHYDEIAKGLNQPELTKPSQFMLAKNYRSHQGILSFASWVMQLLWNGFPETIDKLDPEVGETRGPRPIVFAGFDASILSAKMIGLVKLNDQVADFGAEQVILVRDGVSKDKLQAQIGEIALVMTILESKGMEFEDVLVYDFFGGSGLSSNYRCLHLLSSPGNSFDSQKHAALCSELKHLYVAVTRARRQLWFMETTENGIDPIIKALDAGESSDLVDCVRQGHEDVAEKVSVLRAGGSVDPDRWMKRAVHLLQQKNYADALFCFKKADDPEGIAHAQALLFEQDGRSSRAANNQDEFIENYTKAISLFLGIGRWSEAANCFQGLGRYDKAAELWKEKGQLDLAAELYERGQHFGEASACFHSQMKNRSLLKPNIFHRYSRLLNILLKQGRIQPDLREITINLLGSDDKKVEFFIEFEMFEQLRTFYKGQERWVEYCETCLLLGDIATAMTALFEYDLLSQIKQTVAESIMNYFLAERLLHHPDPLEIDSELNQKLIQPAKGTYLEKSLSQWSIAFQIVGSRSAQGQSKIESLEVDWLRDFISLFILVINLNRFGTRNFNWVALSHEEITAASKVVGNLKSQDDSTAKFLLLLLGIYCHPERPSQTKMLGWSPARNDIRIAGETQEELLRLGKEWVREMFTGAFAEFHDLSINTERRDFNRSCLYFIMRRPCRADRSGVCPYVHEIPDSYQCQKKLDFLVNIVQVFANVSPLFVQNLMPPSFSTKFLSRRRHWAQTLAGELSFISSADQCPAAIMNTRKRLIDEAQWNPTLVILEELMHHIMSKDWRKMHTFTGIMEQHQLAHGLSVNVFFRYRRALQTKMRGILRRNTSTTHPLRLSDEALRHIDKIFVDVAEYKSSEFLSEVPILMELIEEMNSTSLSHFCSLLTFMELISTYILCRIRPFNAIVLPWSWSTRFLPLTMTPEKALLETSDIERRDFIQCLHKLISKFCKIVKRAILAISTGEIVLQGLTRYPVTTDLIKRRTFDYFTTILLNLSHYPVEPRGVREILDQMREILPFVLPQQFAIPKSPKHLLRPMLEQYEKYNGKDYLQVVTLVEYEGCPPALSNFLASRGPVSLSSIESVSCSKNEEFTYYEETREDIELNTHEVELICKLQHRWRLYRKISDERRRAQKTIEGRLIEELFKLMKEKWTEPAASLRRVINICRIQARKRIFSALPLMVGFENAHGDFQRLKAQFKRTLDNASSIHDIDELYAIHDMLPPIEHQLSTLGRLLTVKGLSRYLQALHSSSFDSDFRDYERKLITMIEKLENIRGRVEAIR
ncbi:hypothetical protein N7456_004424 [Penicillium angulare]|uniref:UvrD-like helicase ATP-binding domain-containing protein n=1 Tax=Penicillium angulare TaxID=116970 RepID=A0A9W9FWK2_9EURO|nr:hypothetical protein N7456_004424 [Penicillium angulare]